MYLYTSVVVVFNLLLFMSVRCVARLRKCEPLLFVRDLDSEDTHVKEKPSKELSNLLSNNVTEKYKEKFKVYVSNTGPAVIGSEIDFLAELYTEIVDIDKKHFLYHWMNDADDSEKLETTNNYRSNISSYIFDSELILPNKYKMKVCVYKRHKENFVIIGENHTMFELTATLNGRSHIHQNLTFNGTSLDIFSTNRVIQYSVNLTDKFHSTPPYWFHLFVDGQRVETKENVNFFDFIRNSTGMIQVKVQVVMESFGTEGKLQGNWSRSIYLEDEVQKVNIVSDSEIITGNPVKFNISFDGSDVRICWRIVDLDNNTAHNRSCDGPLSSGWFLTPGVVLPPGQYIADVVVTNDISSVNHRSGVNVVYNGGGSGTSSPLVVPIVFSMLGMVVLLSGAAYIVRLRKKKDVEVADFDFHPEIQSTGFRIFQMIRGSISDMFQRNEYVRRHRRAKYHQTLARSYGSLEDSNEVL